MKKFLSIILATLLAVSVFTGCAKQTCAVSSSYEVDTSNGGAHRAYHVPHDK